MTVGLPLSRLINVAVTLSPPAAQFPNFNTLLLLTTSTVIDVTTRMMTFTSLDQVATTFGTDGPEYAAAQLWFGQQPSPTTMLIGRWVDEASAGQLFGGPLAAENRVVGPWNAILNGAFKMTVDGVGPQEIGNLDFSGAANMNAVAAVITSGFPGGSCVCEWDATNSRFVFTSQTTGAASIISFASAPDAGTDISGMMAALVNSAGAYQADGLDAQTALDTVVLFNNRFSSQWYGLCIPEATDADHLAVAAYIEASTAVRHYYGVTTQDPDTKVVGNDTCVAAELKALELNHTGVQYSSTSAYAVVSALARILTTDWEANNSTITLMYKQEPLVVAEDLTETEAQAIAEKNCNVFVAYNNDTAIIQYGQSASGQFVDSVIGTDWLAASLQTAAYNLLYQSATKIPQTDAGMHQLGAQFESVLDQAVSNGLLAAGIWTAQGFGQLKTGDNLPKGYYVYIPPVALQSAADRAARKSVPFQIAAKLGGAVHTVDVSLQIQA